MKTLTTTAVRDHECLPCYIDRMIRASGCDNHLRWAGEWGRANRLPGLLRWLRANGGYCDCEVLFNVYRDLDDVDTAETDDNGRRVCRGVPRGVRDACQSLRR